MWGGGGGRETALVNVSISKGGLKRQRVMFFSVSKHTVLSVICRDDTKQVCRPSDRDVNWMTPEQGESPPVQVKNPTVVYMITCRLSSCKTCVYCVRMLRLLERGCSSMYKKKEKDLNHLHSRGGGGGVTPYILYGTDVPLE